MRSYPKKRKDPVSKISGVKGFPLGLNTQSHPSAIKNEELSEAQNVAYTQNGVLEKRLGSLSIGSPRGSSTRINALCGVYDIGEDKSDYLIRISDDGIAQTFDFDTEEWSDIAGSPTFSNVNTEILEANGFVYFLNEEDDMTKWDGASWYVFTPLSNPTEAAVLAKVGSGTGNTHWYYRYVWYNNVGYTTGPAATEDDLDNMPDILDENTYITVTVPSAPSGTTKIGIFRGKSSGDEIFLGYIEAAQTVYYDKGQDDEDQDPLFGVPTINTTQGYHFKNGIVTVYKDTLIGITVEMGDDTLTYSAGGDEFDNFGLAAGAGYFAWRKGDGDPGNAVASFQDELYFFKKRKIGAFKFDEAGGTMKDINLAVGAVSQRAVHPAGNDMRFWTPDGAYSMGNEANFANIIRTRIISARADSITKSITASDLESVCSVFFNNLSIWGIPTGLSGAGNSSEIVYDERYVAWSNWIGMKPNVFAKFEVNGVQRLFYGDTVTGNVIEMFTGYSDNDEPIVWRITTKQFDLGKPYAYKTFSQAFLIFGNVSGVDTDINLIENGTSLVKYKLALFETIGKMGWGNDQFGTQQFGETSGTAPTNASGLLVRWMNLRNRDLFSIQMTLTNDGLLDRIQFMGLYFEYADSSLPLPSTMELKRDYS
jgi:hypothetical protein